MREFVTAVCGALLLGAGPGLAQQAVVVELFTSQGCVACPPADAFFATLVRDPRVIPLALHVDYWDYIGWADSFADPRFTERQKAYARAVGSRTIYTPQFIIGGKTRIEGFEPEEAEAEMAERLRDAAQSPVRLSVRRQGETLAIRASADPPLPAPVRVELVRYAPERTVTIERGENAGKTITYRNIVISWDVLGEWSGREPLDIATPAPGDAPAVVILQDEGPGPILAAARPD